MAAAGGGRQRLEGNGSCLYRGRRNEGDFPSIRISEVSDTEGLKGNAGSEVKGNGN